jgi:hypothetical protein
MSLLLAKGLHARQTGRSMRLPTGLMGYVIECLVEAYVLVGAAGRITTARPDVDLDHKDLLVDERGGFRYIYIQVKGSPKLHANGNFYAVVEYPNQQIMADTRLWYVFCLFDVNQMKLARIWLVPSHAFRRHAPRSIRKDGHVRLTFAAGKSGKWTPYEIDPMTLGVRLVAIIKRQNASTLSRRLSGGNRVGRQSRTVTPDVQRLKRRAA